MADGTRLSVAPPARDRTREAAAATTWNSRATCVRQHGASAPYQFDARTTARTHAVHRTDCTRTRSYAAHTLRPTRAPGTGTHAIPRGRWQEVGACGRHAAPWMKRSPPRAREAPEPSTHWFIPSKVASAWPGGALPRRAASPLVHNECIMAARILGRSRNPPMMHSLVHPQRCAESAHDALIGSSTAVCGIRRPRTGRCRRAPLRCAAAGCTWRGAPSGTEPRS